MSLSIELKTMIWHDHLDAGHAEIGSKLPTVADLAAQYKVSMPTIVKAVGMLADEGWVTSRKGSGVYVAKQALAQEEANVNNNENQKKIGYVTADISSTIIYHAMRGIEYAARKSNVALEVACTNFQLEEEERQIVAMRERGVDGVVLFPTTFRNRTREYLSYRFTDYPIVVLDLYEPSMKRPHLLFDNVAAGREMTRYLIDHGHTNIAFLRPDIEPLRSVDDRVIGYREALAEAGIGREQHVLINNMAELSKYHGYERFLDCVHEVLELNPRPTALIGYYDYVVPDVISCLKHYGLSVPGDMTVVGFDNLVQDYRVDWPTTNPDFVRMGEWAAELLIEGIEDGVDAIKDTRIVMPCPLLINRGQTVQSGNGLQTLWPKSKVRVQTREKVVSPVK
ncbi:MAG: GntR family transcriptional regulator [Sedimentisphaerales bacterium]|nr:GntR family transcriptional regulator [Sedimentisphaerales bacterium]